MKLNNKAKSIIEFTSRLTLTQPCTDIPNKKTKCCDLERQ